MRVPPPHLWTVLLLGLVAAMLVASGVRRPRVFQLRLATVVPADAESPRTLLDDGDLSLAYTSSDLIRPAQPDAEAILVPLWARGETTRGQHTLPWVRDLRTALAQPARVEAGPAATATSAPDTQVLVDFAARIHGPSRIDRGTADCFHIPPEAGYRRVNGVRTFLLGGIRVVNADRDPQIAGRDVRLAEMLRHGFRQLRAAGVTRVAIPFFLVPAERGRPADAVASWSAILDAAIDAARHEGITRLVCTGSGGAERNYDGGFREAWTSVADRYRAQRFALVDEAVRLPALFILAAALGWMARRRPLGWRTALALLVLGLSLSGLAVFSIAGRALAAVGLVAGESAVVALVKVLATVAAGWWLRELLHWDPEKALKET